MKRDAWLAARKVGLGGSDLAVILGLSPFKTPLGLWLEKTGRAADDDLAARRRSVRFGSFAEDFVAAEYTLATGRAVQRFTRMLHHPRAPILGNLDRLVIPAGAKVAAHQGQIRTELGLECKTASAFAALDQGAWGESGTDHVPPAYLVQCAAYMALSGCMRWDLAVLFGNGAGDRDFRIYHLARDAELEAMLEARAAEWWRRHVEADMPPEPTSEADVALLYPRSTPRTVQADGDAERAVANLAHARAERAAIEDAEAAAAMRVKTILGEADTLAAGERVLATWKSARDTASTDWQAVARAIAARAFDSTAQLDALIALHTTTKPGARRLILKGSEA